MQVSIYAKNVYVGTMARNAAGVFVVGVDPWVRDDLFNYSGTPDEGPHKRQYRLLDAIYSTAARNNVPTGVIGEAIMYLSRGQDLNAFATFNERLVLIYSQTARGKDGATGRVLYVGVLGGEKTLECFVFQQSDGEFACVTGDDQVRSLTVTNGMVTPVSGVMTSTFGPRKHPILGTVRIHKGVDWAAPIGTPIVAAFDGQIAFEGDGGGYGNLVRISHANGRETRYAHMSRFAPNIGVGAAVKAGDIIGYVGTTGLSTGPHLHFELYQNNDAIDPLGTVTVLASDDSAVELLTNRIIHVESGGSARAKNPLSSATGLGQFISSTWIRMMNTYRPDLARTLSQSRAACPALRPDHLTRNGAQPGARRRSLSQGAGSPDHRRPAVSLPLPWHGGCASGADRIRRRNADRPSRDLGDPGQSIPHRQECRLRRQLGGKKDERPEYMDPVASHFGYKGGPADIARVREIQERNQRGRDFRQGHYLRHLQRGRIAWRCTAR